MPWLLGSVLYHGPLPVYTDEQRMMRAAIPLLCFVLVACGNNPPSPPPPLPPPLVLPFTISGNAAWAITQGSAPRALSNGTFDFQRCASASTCWDSYVEVAYGVNMAGAASVTLEYEITGDNPVFVNDSPNNTCGGPPALSLLLHRTGDAALTIPTYRQFSFPSRQSLTVGENSYRVPIDISQWINVSGQGFGDTLANIGSLGFVLGGGCFAGHGVAVSSGLAVFKISSYTVQ